MKSKYYAYSFHSTLTMLYIVPSIGNIFIVVEKVALGFKIERYDAPINRYQLVEISESEAAPFIKEATDFLCEMQSVLNPLTVTPAFDVVLNYINTKEIEAQAAQVSDDPKWNAHFKAVESTCDDIFRYVKSVKELRHGEVIQ